MKKPRESVTVNFVNSFYMCLIIQSFPILQENKYTTQDFIKVSG